MLRLLLSLSLCLTGLDARATLVTTSSVEELTQVAPRIVRGTVVASVPRVHPERGGVETFTTVQVKRTLRGEGSAMLTVWQPGGTVGELTTRVSGAAAFSPGEEVVLFLEPLDPGPDGTTLFVPVALSAAKFLLVPDGLESRVLRNSTGIGFYLKNLCAELPVREGGLEDFGTEEAFLAQVMMAVAAEEAR